MTEESEKELKKSCLTKVKNKPINCREANELHFNFIKQQEEMDAEFRKEYRRNKLLYRLPFWQVKITKKIF